MDDSNPMDEASKDAVKELDLMKSEEVVAVAKWVKKWKDTAGYKRLGYALIEYLERH